jgi:DNA-binding beta-propeller fold protein YncE
MKWSATAFYPPNGDVAAGRHVYVTCDNEVSIINTADHSVRTVHLNDPGKSIGAIVVSADSSKAWVSVPDPRWKSSIYIIDAQNATVASRLPLQDTPIPSGATSLAVSGDGSTLYAVGIGKAGAAIVALDAASGTVKSTRPMPKGYTGGELVFNPRLVISGSNLVLDDGTIVDIAVPSGAHAIFGSDSRGLAAFPDGKRICSPNGVVTVGTRAVERKPGCSAISPDGALTYQSGQQLRSEAGTAATNADFGAVVSWLGAAVGMAPDGKSLYTLGGSLSGAAVYTIERATHLTTDAIRVCEGPHLIGMEPLHAP